MKKIFTNYKTSIPAAITCVLVVLRFTNLIDSTQLAEGTALLVAAGLLGAKDYDNK